jgi:hypothetical protein
MRFGRFLPGVLQMRCVVGMGEVFPRLLLGDALVIALDVGGRPGRAVGSGSSIAATTGSGCAIGAGVSCETCSCAASWTCP